MKECKETIKYDIDKNILDYDANIASKISKLYKVLGDKNRALILYLLKDKSMCVHELIRVLKVEQSLVSHQLRVLREACIVKTERSGNEIIYSLADDHINILLDIAKEHVEEKKNEKGN